ncbi:MAG: restriction endonuclease, partial [Sphingomonas bacterium]|uniref:transporter substrate-binding domain-containing protein n=1 Tax=Sphingomonas bacterium TaxID=1895847 RepID=UPI0026177F8D
GEAVGRPIRLIDHEGAGAIVAARDWDVAFIAVDPVRATTIHFTESYLTIEATYAVATNAPFESVAEVDREGVRIASSQGGAYDLELRRTLRFATLESLVGPAASSAAFAAGGYDALAGIRPVLDGFVAEHQGFRVLADSFHIVRQAVATHADRPAAAALLDRFVGQGLSDGSFAKAVAAR